jgi:hypothetical protein
VTVAPRSKNQAIILVKGTESELDGKAMPYQVDGQGERIDYRTQLHGRDYVTVAVRSGYGGRRSFTLGVPNRRDDINLAYDDKLSKELKPESVFALYESQRSVVAALQAFDRKSEEARHNKAYADSLEAMNKACGTKVTGSIDWKSISDDLVKTYSISSFCENPVSSLEHLCSSSDGKSVIKAKVKQVNCQFGAAMKLDVKGGTVSWITAKDAPNQEDFATQYFEKNL